MSAVIGRLREWIGSLDLHGYEINDAESLHAAVLIRATRAPLYRGPETKLIVREALLPGSDPLRLSPPINGHHLARGSWHAQIGGDGAERGTRVDFDRTKPIGLERHIHPYGRENAVRARTQIATPRAWLEFVEETVCELYDRLD